MMKSCERYLLGIYEAMFKDIVGVFPNLRVDCERDCKRLLSIVEKGGHRFLTIDLPAMGKLFDISLSQGRLDLQGSPHMRGYRRGSPIPRLFKGLFLRVFDESGVLRESPCIASIRYLRQAFGLVKRFRIQCDNSYTFQAVSEFYQVDSAVDLPSLSWDEDTIDVSKLNSLSLRDRRPNIDAIEGSLFRETSLPAVPFVPISLLTTAQRVADIVVSHLGEFNPLEWHAKHGPGAVSDQRTGKDKYLFPTWPDKLESVFPVADFGFPNYQHWVDFIQSEDVTFMRKHEAPSRLIAVPKTATGPRLIASEPTSHQWCQQTIRDFLATRVANTPIRHSVNFRSQVANQKLALSASHSQSHATIDLSSASDRVSCWLVERIFRRCPSVVRAFHASRTRWISNEIDKKSPKFYKLRKFSTMGSAVTFPVQTYLFAIIAIASVIYDAGANATIASVTAASRQVRVFGDDIVVPNDSCGTTRGLLGYLGLKVNTTKTFETGKFRESCGVDAFDGHDVTKVSVLTMPDVSRPESIMSAVDTHNNLVMRGYECMAAYIKSTVDGLKRFSFPSVPIGSGSLGWYNYFGAMLDHLKRRFNTHLQVVEYLITVPVARTMRVPSLARSMVLQYFTEVKFPPRTSTDERLGIPSIPTTKLRRRWVRRDQLTN